MRKIARGIFNGALEHSDVAHQAKEWLLPVHLRAPAQREAIEPLVVAHIGKRRLHGGEAAAVLFAPWKCSPTCPFVTLRAPLRFSDFPAGQTHTCASRRPT